MPTTTKTNYKVTQRRILHLTCLHCQHGWYPSDGVVPKICPKCKYLLSEPEGAEWQER